MEKTINKDITAILPVMFTATFFMLFTACANDRNKINNNNEQGNNKINKSRIYVDGNQFKIEGKRIWINGVNTPWNKWNDFGGSFDRSWWDAEFKKLRDHGVNATRIWINCNSQCAIGLDADGTVNSVTASHWTHLDQLFELAKKHGIFIMATLLSFDHFKSPSSGTDYSPRWRAMIQSDAASKSFVDNYTIPFVNRYKDNPWLWSIDIMNEPDWVFENSECGNISWEYLSYFFAINAAVIRENSDILVTVGMAYPKWNKGAGTSVNGENNKVSDAFLADRYTSRGLTPNPNAVMDFWSPHYYDWVGEWFQIPFYGTPSKWGLPDSKPSLIGEFSARGIQNNWSNKYPANSGMAINNIINDYESAYSNGWQGVMAWTSNGVDGNGGIPGNGMSASRNTQLGDATLNMLAKYRELIYPL